LENFSEYKNISPENFLLLYRKIVKNKNISLTLDVNNHIFSKSKSV